MARMHYSGLPPLPSSLPPLSQLYLEGRVGAPQSGEEGFAGHSEWPLESDRAPCGPHWIADRFQPPPTLPEPPGFQASPAENLICVQQEQILHPQRLGWGTEGRSSLAGAPPLRCRTP